MAIIAAQIKEKLQAAFAPTHLLVTDDSARHAGHAGARVGGETHFTVEMTAASLHGLSRLEQQRAVYTALDGLMNNPIHALVLRLGVPA